MLPKNRSVETERQSKYQNDIDFAAKKDEDEINIKEERDNSNHSQEDDIEHEEVSN